ncbi:MAG: hypothetical protein ACE5HX_16425 [bacterium]
METLAIQQIVKALGFGTASAIVALLILSVTNRLKISRLEEDLRQLNKKLEKFMVKEEIVLRFDYIKESLDSLTKEIKELRTLIVKNGRK